MLNGMLDLVQAIVKETLRLHPAVPLSLPHTNKVRTPFTARYEMPANTSVLIDYAAIGRDPEVWGAKPLHFDPRRFTETDAASQIDTFKLLPFGYGRRGCPGANLGVILVQLALAYLVQGFDWLPSKGLLPHDVHTLEAPGVFSFRSIILTHFCYISLRVCTHVESQNQHSYDNVSEDWLWEHTLWAWESFSLLELRSVSF